MMSVLIRWLCTGMLSLILPVVTAGGLMDVEYSVLSGFMNADEAPASL